MYRCQCKKCGNVFNLDEATGIGAGSKKSPCCQWRFIVLDDKLGRWLDKKYLDVNNDPRYYEYKRQY